MSMAVFRMNGQKAQHIQFQIGDETYAVAISDIREIIRMQEIREIPGVASYVRGVIHLRGSIVPVVSLRLLFGKRETEPGKQTRIIIVNHRSGTVGLIVDKVDSVVTFSDIQPPPEQTGSTAGVRFIGIGILRDALVGILKLDQVLI